MRLFSLLRNFLHVPNFLFYFKEKTAFPFPHDIPLPTKDFLFQMAYLKTESLLSLFHTTFQGLTDQEAASLLQDLPHFAPEKSSVLQTLQHLWTCYWNPFNILLSTLAIIAYKTHDIASSSLILLMVSISILLRFLQERKSYKAAEKLKALVSTTTTVIRRQKQIDTEKNSFSFIAQKIEKEANELVPGDIVHLSAGDKIPTDLRLLSTKDLFIDQSLLTGESLPVEKKVTAKKTQHIFDLENMCYMGTHVISGTALGLVLYPPAASYMGHLHHHLALQTKTPSPLYSHVHQLSLTFMRLSAFMVSCIFFINLFTKHTRRDSLVVAISLAVGLTPEMLPLIVTTTLARGALNLSHRKVIVKNLESIHTLGAMTLLCTDKTGTLTQNKICLQYHTDAWGTPCDSVLEYAYLNSFHQTGLKNVLDTAILTHFEAFHDVSIAHNYEKIDEIPFDFVRRRMSVIVKDLEGNQLLICKGAIEEILKICSTVYCQETSLPLSSNLKHTLLKTTQHMNQEGLRVLAVARKVMPSPLPGEKLPPAQENQLELLGYLGFLDPPKDSAASALEFLTKHGIDIKVLTGDNLYVTQKICQEVGLKFKGVLLGPEIEHLSDAELFTKAEKATIFAKLSPFDKQRLVQLFKNNGQVVGFMGDGINDANALQAADIGISVDSAVDIAKESADIILLEKNLGVVGQGIMEGRRTFLNLLKYLKMVVSSNFGNACTLLISSLFLPFLPLQPLQILIQNLLYDISQLGIPFDGVDKKDLEKPCTWNPSELLRFMKIFGPISSLFDLWMVSILWFGFHACTLSQQHFFQTGFFLESLLSQIIIVHLIRTSFKSKENVWPSAALLVSTFSMIGLGFFLCLGPVAPLLGFTPLPGSFYLWLAIVVIGYMLAVLIVKKLTDLSMFSQLYKKRS